MAVLADKKIVGGGFGNEAEIVRVQYNFANDTGAIADYDVLVADKACIVHLIHADVKTAVTSGGSLVVDLGKNAGGTEMWSDKAVAALTLDSLHLGTGPVKLAAADKIVLGLEAATATAGKIEFVFAIYAV